VLLCDPVLLFKSPLQKVGESALPCAPETKSAAFYWRRAPTNLSLYVCDIRAAGALKEHRHHLNPESRAELCRACKMHCTSECSRLKRKSNFSSRTLLHLQRCHNRVGHEYVHITERAKVIETLIVYYLRCFVHNVIKVSLAISKDIF
jgi:hypothetical protein